MGEDESDGNGLSDRLGLPERLALPDTDAVSDGEGVTVMVPVTGAEAVRVTVTVGLERGEPLRVAVDVPNIEGRVVPVRDAPPLREPVEVTDGVMLPVATTVVVSLNEALGDEDTLLEALAV